MKFRFIPDIAVEVGNLAEAKKFYMDVLGMEFISENGTEAKLSASEGNFYVSASDARKTYFAFEVDSLSEAKKILLDNNCVITSEGPEFLIVDDPHGLSYAVSEKKS